MAVATTIRSESYKGSIAEGWMLWHGPRGLSYKLVQDNDGWELLAIETRTNVRRHEVRLTKRYEGYPAWAAMAWHTVPNTGKRGPIDVLNDHGCEPDSCYLAN